MNCWKSRMLQVCWPLVGILSLLLVLQSRDPVNLLIWLHIFAVLLCCTPLKACPNAE